MSDKGKISVVVCGILAINGLILLGRRAQKDGDPIAGKWVTPGGHVESGETQSEAVEREFLEETGLLVRAVLNFAHSEEVGPEPIFLIFMQVVPDGRMAFQPSLELPIIEWFKWEEIEDLYRKGMTTPETYRALQKFLK